MAVFMRICGCGGRRQKHPVYWTGGVPGEAPGEPGLQAGTTCRKGPNLKTGLAIRCFEYGEKNPITPGGQSHGAKFFQEVLKKAVSGPPATADL
jgi:hypothetical protein